MDRITPGWKPHGKLESDIEDFLVELGFLTIALPYHEYLEEKLRTLIQYRFTPATLYLRSRADRFAFHPEILIDFEFDAKTHASKKYWDMTIEALPLISHLSKWKSHEIPCLYCYRDERAGDKGFWIKELPKIRCFMIPKRWTDEGVAYYHKVITKAFPDTQVIKMNNKGFGSGDPFAVIDESDKNSLEDWRILIKKLF